MTARQVKLVNKKSLWMKRGILLFLVSLLSFYGFSQDTEIGIKTVVIDPGHGGKDPGAVGYSGVYEKDIALDVSLKVGDMIKEKYPDVEVIYTRKTDEFVSLYGRAKLANEKKADLFISIHANSAENRSAYGSETWVLGLHKTAAALEVAKRENASILMEENYETKYEDFDPNNPDDYISLALRQSAFLEQSLGLAANIQHHFKNGINRYDRGVKQAGFLVLYKTTMPAVLVELGFISNKNEEAYLSSEKGKKELAESIFKGFESYKKDVESVNDAVSGNGDNKTDESTNNEENNTVEKEEVDPDKTVYKVQFQMSSNNIALKPENFKGLEDVDVYESNGFYKYTSGEFDTFDEANEHKRKVREIGYTSAFVVVFKGGKRIK